MTMMPIVPPIAPIKLAIDGLVKALDDLVVDHEVIDRVKKELERSARELDGGSFQNYRPSAAIFGGAESGAELGFHHGKAHQIVADTINGVIADLEAFRTNVVRATELLTEADDATAADFNRGAALLTAASMNDNADRANHQSRNENLAPGGSEGGDA